MFDEDELVVIKRVLEDAVLLSLSDARKYLREPRDDMKRVLEKIQLHLNEIDEDQRGLLEIEAGNGDEQ